MSDGGLWHSDIIEETIWPFGCCSTSASNSKFSKTGGVVNV